MLRKRTFCPNAGFRKFYTPIETDPFKRNNPTRLCVELHERLAFHHSRGRPVMQNVGSQYIDETSIEARAAFRGRLVLYGLMFGTLGTIGVLAIVYLCFFA
jgi:hypothetical protein